VYIEKSDLREAALNQRRTILTAIGFMLAILSGCRPLHGGTATSPGEPDLSIPPQFEAFLREYGLTDTAGPPLEGPMTEGAVVRQLFLALELEYHSDAAPGAQVRLSPLGLQLGLAEPPVPPPAQSEGRYFPDTGHTIYTGFLQRYESMGGAAVLGAPISEAKFQAGKIFQYFENVGIYRQQDAPPSAAGLLSLGAASRPELDLEGVVSERVVLPPAIVFQPFSAFIQNLDAESLFGAPLTEPYVAPDGSLEQVYERAVLYSPKSDPEDAHLRPLGLDLGPPEPAVPPVQDAGTLYIPKYGHNIRWAFVDFYRNRNGDVILGLPLAEPKLFDALISQRFEKGILEYDYNLPPEFAFQLAPLGRKYLGNSAASSERSSMAVPSPSATEEEPREPSAGQGLSIRSWALHPVLAEGQQQILYVEVRSGSGQPAQGVTPLVAIYRRDSEIYPPLGPTDEEGMTAISLSPIDFRPGEIINYEVVISAERGYAYAWGQFAVQLGTPWP
jgi:hypothetical protein